MGVLRCSPLSVSYLNYPNAPLLSVGTPTKKGQLVFKTRKFYDNSFHVNFFQDKVVEAAKVCSLP